LTSLQSKLSQKLSEILTLASERQLLRSFLAKIDFEALLLVSAQRKAYGDPPKHHDLYADETKEAVWAWELV